MGAIIAALTPLAVLGLLIWTLNALRARPGPLSTVEVRGTELVLVVRAPVWLAFRRELRAPLAAVTGARVVPPGTRAGLSVRVCGTGWFGLYLGYFWRRGTGLCYVVRRPARESVEIDLAGRRVKQWLVETDSPEAVTEMLRGVGVPAA
jgi:hypothetical protein